MADQKEILESIRDIIAGKAPSDDDILELTTMVNDDGSTTDIKASKVDEIVPISQESHAEGDILSEIDSILGDKPEPQKVELEFADFSADNPETVISAPTIPEAIEDKGEPKMSDEAIISDESANAAKATISGMLSTLQSKKSANDFAAGFRSGNTVEDLVLESLKPMLKEWLDANLSTIVKELVEKEIKRIIP